MADKSQIASPWSIRNHYFWCEFAIFDQEITLECFFFKMHHNTVLQYFVVLPMWMLKGGLCASWPFQAAERLTHHDYTVRPTKKETHKSS